VIQQTERLTMKTTKENLQEAFAGESQANQKYRAFAKKAERDGFPNIAKLFKTAAEAERIHAEGHLSSLDGIGSTVENHKAKRMFGYAVKAEKVHAELYQMALEAAANGKDLEVTEIYLCPVCGHIEFGKPTENCPTCGALPSKFEKL